MGAHLADGVVDGRRDELLVCEGWRQGHVWKFDDLLVGLMSESAVPCFRRAAVVGSMGGHVGGDFDI